MVSIREYQYKVINDTVYLGMELEVSGESFYKNSKIIVEFIKDGNVVKIDDSFVIPMLVGEGIFCLGKEFKKEVDFDEINVSFELGEKEYEEIYDLLIEWSFNKFDEETREISYKIKNANKEPIEYAVLNLVFFNKGELVAGTNIKLENLLNEREYYFEYQIPETIEYTEIHPYIMFPATNRLFYKGFYLKYNELQDKIEETSKDLQAKNKEEFVDKTLEYQNRVDEEKKKLEEIKKLPDQKTTSIFGKNLVILFKNLFKCIPDLFTMILGLAFLNTFTIIIGFIYCVIAFAGTIGVIGYLFQGKILESLGSLLIVVGPILVIAAICYIPYYIFYCCKESKLIKKKDLITLEEKNNKIKEQEERVLNAENAYNNYVNNIDKFKNDVVVRNQEIENENATLELKNKENHEKHNSYKQQLSNLLESYPDYRIIETYDELDWEIVDNAILEGGYRFEDIEEYRNIVRNNVLEERAKMEQELRQIEAEQRQEALQQQLLNQLAAVKSEVSQMQREQAEFARQQLSYAASQAYAYESINRKVGQLKDAQSLSNVYQENMYNRFH